MYSESFQSRKKSTTSLNLGVKGMLWDTYLMSRQNKDLCLQLPSI